MRLARPSVRGLLVTMGLMTGGAGCSSGEPAVAEVVDTASEQTLVLAQRTVILDPDEVAAALVSEGTVLFRKASPDVKRLNPGWIMVGTDPTTNAVFVRRVTASLHLVDGMVLLNTEDAAITEATTVLEAHKALELPALDYAKVDEELFASSGIRIACAACSVHFQPRLGFDISIRESRLEHLRLGLAGPFSAQLQVKAETTLPATKLQQEIPLLNRSQTFVQLVGPLPLVAKVDTEWVATVEGTWNSHGSVAFRFDTNRSLDLSLVREAGAWHGVSQADGSWSFESPILETVQQGEGSLTLRAKAKLTLMAVASTTFVTEAHGQATWSVLPPPMTWSANTALRVGAEASLQIPHLVDKTWSGTLFHTEQMWASSKTGLPVPFREAASPQSVRQSLLAASP